MKRGAAWGLVVGLIGGSTTAESAQMFVCEQRDGPAILSDRKSTLPKDCEPRVLTMEDAPAQNATSVSSERKKAIDAVIQQTRQRRAADEARQNEWLTTAQAAQEELNTLQSTIFETIEQLHHERYRWSALFPGDWIPFFADPREILHLETRVTQLRWQEERLLVRLENLRREGRLAHLPPSFINKTLPPARRLDVYWTEVFPESKSYLPELYGIPNPIEPALETPRRTWRAPRVIIRPESGYGRFDRAW